MMDGSIEGKCPHCKKKISIGITWDYLSGELFCEHCGYTAELKSIVSLVVEKDMISKLQTEKDAGVPGGGNEIWDPFNSSDILQIEDQNLHHNKVVIRHSSGREK